MIVFRKIKQFFRFKLFLLSILISIIIASYFEAKIINIYMPLRNFIYVPDKLIENEQYQVNLPKGLVYEQSKDGYYVNPWTSSSLLSDEYEKVFNHSCKVMNNEEKQQIIDIADYFIQTVKHRSFQNIDFYVWEYPINWSYSLKPGWISSMAQGKIAELFAVAYLCTNKMIYNEYMNKTINSFSVAVENGGILVEMPIGQWYEEYAQDDVPSPLVLNGHIYAIQSLKYLIPYNNQAEKLYDEGLKAIIDNIQKYDAVTWSMYDTVGTPANNVYQQKLHVRQMKELYEDTGNEIFKYYYQKFHLQEFSPFSSIQRLIYQPTRFLIFIIVVNTGIIFILLTLANIIFQKIKRKS